MEGKSDDNSQVICGHGDAMKVNNTLTTCRTQRREVSAVVDFYEQVQRAFKTFTDALETRNTPMIPDLTPSLTSTSLSSSLKEQSSSHDVQQQQQQQQVQPPPLPPPPKGNESPSTKHRNLHSDSSHTMDPFYKFTYLPINATTKGSHKPSIASHVVEKLAITPENEGASKAMENMVQSTSSVLDSAHAILSPQTLQTLQQNLDNLFQQSDKQDILNIPKERLDSTLCTYLTKVVDILRVLLSYDIVASPVINHLPGYRKKIADVRNLVLYQPNIIGEKSRGRNRFLIESLLPQSKIPKGFSTRMFFTTSDARSVDMEIAKTKISNILQLPLAQVRDYVQQVCDSNSQTTNWMPFEKAFRFVLQGLKIEDIFSQNAGETISKILSYYECKCTWNESNLSKEQGHRHLLVLCAWTTTGCLLDELESFDSLIDMSYQPSFFLLNNTLPNFPEIHIQLTLSREVGRIIQGQKRKRSRRRANSSGNDNQNEDMDDNNHDTPRETNSKISDHSVEPRPKRRKSQQASNQQRTPSPLNSSTNPSSQNPTPRTIPNHTSGNDGGIKPP